MTKEQTTFIRILSDHLNKRKTTIPYDLDWDVMLAYARTHQVAGIVYAQAKQSMPLEIMELFRRETIASCCHFSVREEICRTLKRLFSDADIPYFIIKGPVIADLYPDPALRLMGDVDIVVHPEDRDACHEILVSNGFLVTSKQDGREWQYYKNNIEFELHDRLVYRETVNRKGHDIYFNDCWKYVKDSKLDWGFHLLFLIFHLRKHLMNAGAGFRHYMDIAVVAEKIQIDWDWLTTNLQITGMYEFAQKCFGLTERWFGIQTPISCELEPGFCDMATNKTFDDGIFGFDNTDNEDSDVVNMVRKKKFSILGKIQMALSHLFPAGWIMKEMKPYSYLKKCPVLLPIAWMHRLVRGIIGKKDRVLINRMKSAFVSNEIIDKREEMLKKWGL